MAKRRVIAEEQVTIYPGELMDMVNEVEMWRRRSRRIREYMLRKRTNPAWPNLTRQINGVTYIRCDAVAWTLRTTRLKFDDD